MGDGRIINETTALAILAGYHDHVGAPAGVRAAEVHALTGTFCPVMLGDTGAWVGRVKRDVESLSPYFVRYGK